MGLPRHGYRGAVTRIISGRAGSIALDVPDAGTRPTSDRVRESLFAALESAGAVEGARVLDLYAGSGALGLEAQSRGAASVDLIEKAARAAAVAQRNAQRVARAIGGVPARVHRAAAETFVQGTRGPYDLVLIDPPYDLPDTTLAQVLDALVPALAPDAVVVVERSRRSDAPTPPAGLEHTRDRRYGDTTLWWLRRTDV